MGNLEWWALWLGVAMLGMFVTSVYFTYLRLLDPKRFEPVASRYGAYGVKPRIACIEIGLYIGFAIWPLAGPAALILCFAIGIFYAIIWAPLVLVPNLIGGKLIARRKAIVDAELAEKQAADEAHYEVEKGAHR